MKVILFLFTVQTVCFPLTMSGQGCKLLKNEIDDFTGEKILETHFIKAWGRFMPPEYINLGFANNGGEYSVKVYFQSGEIVDKSFISTDDKLLLKLENGGVIKTNAANNQQSRIERAGTTIIKSFTSEYRLTPEDVSKLKGGKIEKIRYTYNGEAIEKDYEVKGNKAKKLFDGFLCVLSD